MLAPAQDEIDEILNQCMEAFDAGSRWPGATYEQGVEAAIRWMQGEGDNPMED